MSTKIFPFRPAPNPTKCRATAGLPDHPKPDPEDRRIMRQLVAEQAALALAKRAAALPPAQPKTAPLPISVWAFEPELILAFVELSSRAGRRRMPAATVRAIRAGAEFLVSFGKCEPHACEVCGKDITATKQGNVPHGVFVCEHQYGIAAYGLCQRCIWIKIEREALTTEGKPCVITVHEWMATAVDGPDKPEPPRAL